MEDGSCLEATKFCFSLQYGNKNNGVLENSPDAGDLDSNFVCKDV